MEQKSSKLEAQTMSKKTDEEEFKKTIISDQYIDRLQESTKKRDRTAR